MFVHDGLPSSTDKVSLSSRIACLTQWSLVLIIQENVPLVRIILKIFCAECSGQEGCVCSVSVFKISLFSHVFVALLCACPSFRDHFVYLYTGRQRFNLGHPVCRTKIKLNKIFKVYTLWFNFKRLPSNLG